MLGKPVPMTRLGLGFLVIPLAAACTTSGNVSSPSDAGVDATKKDASPSDTRGALLGLAHMHRKQGALTKAAAMSWPRWWTP